MHSIRYHADVPIPGQEELPLGFRDVTQELGVVLLNPSTISICCGELPLHHGAILTMPSQLADRGAKIGRLLNPDGPASLFASDQIS